MNKPDEYIEAYFKEQLSEEERKLFEQRCVEDEVFAKEVAFYITLSESMRQQLLEQKKLEWADAEKDTGSKIDVPVKKMKTLTWLPYIAAACFLFAIMLYFIYTPASPQQFANKYINTHLLTLSQTMDASNDSMQRAIAFYNNKDYDAALEWFEKIAQSHSQDGMAKKYTGIIYLVTNEYDKALAAFDELAAMSGLYNNPGLFLKSVVLLKRDMPGDMAKAKLLLEQVVKEKTDGSREAEKWLKKWK